MPKAKWEKRRVLVVDDETAVREMLKATLEGYYEVMQAKNGREALESAHHWRPDLVLLDVVMPGLGGYEVCSRLKSGRREGPIVILVSALGRDEDIRAGLAAGADAYLVKPIKASALREKVREALDKSREDSLVADSPVKEGDSLAGMSLEQARLYT